MWPWGVWNDGRTKHSTTTATAPQLHTAVLSGLPGALPSGADYRLEDFEGGANLAADPTLAAFSWAMGTYKYVR